ncbi:MAG: type II toxin-antitoxin system HicB family antitoxin [Planctomycetaceae bacterium]|jgi:predicted RNase H-like HicB family nuclease|nr:type II toxin-antitoxin system HicB family antitoxin [Planctomycetaceae bacterium]
MNYHFLLHKEPIGYWAECCELEGCVTEGDSLEEVYAACKEALDVYLYQPEGSERMIPLPDETLDGKKNIITVGTDPQMTTALLLQTMTLNSKPIQVPEIPGRKKSNRSR